MAGASTNLLEIPVNRAENTLRYRLILNETEVHKMCYVGKHLVLRGADIVEYIEMPVGNLVFMVKFFYITQAPENEISFEYNVNGKDVHNICRPDYGSCTLSVIIYEFWKYGGPIKIY